MGIDLADLIQVPYGQKASFDEEEKDVPVLRLLGNLGVRTRVARTEKCQKSGPHLLLNRGMLCSQNGGKLRRSEIKFWPQVLPAQYKVIVLYFFFTFSESCEHICKMDDASVLPR